jgi:hypothetical protein
MRKLLLAISALAAIATTSASADTWTGAYGGTIESTYADGRVVKVFVNQDHSYSIALKNGTILKGMWADADGQSCFTMTDPAQKPDDKPTCFPIKEYKVGDTFQGEDSTGRFTGVVKAGR